MQRADGVVREVSVAERESVPVDPCLVLGDVAGLLADGSALPAALEALVRGLGLRTAVLRAPDGTVLGGSAPEAGAPTLELPVHGRSGARMATLTVSGAVAAQLPALRSAAAVFGLSLVPADEDVERDRDELADALHDGPVQSLVFARYASDAAVRGGDVAAAREAVQAALVDARRFLWQLRPRGGSGLVEALDQLSTHLVESGGRPIGVLGDVAAATALRGGPAVTAYRLVQAVARPQASAVRVILRTDGTSLRLDVEGGAALESPERWARRAAALGGDLRTSAGRIRLVLPNPEARTDA
jgi:signal transduction histidine kinase